MSKIPEITNCHMKGKPDDTYTYRFIACHRCNHGSYGTAQEAKAMLQQAVIAMEADPNAALAAFTDGSFGDVLAMHF